MSRPRMWILLILGAVLVGLTGQGAVLAKLPRAADTGLAVYLPDEQAGQVDWTHRSGAALAGLASACEWTTTFEATVWCLVNQERRAHGLYPYKYNAVLAAVAEQHSATMRDIDCFDHQCPGETSPSRRACDAGYVPYSWGDCFVGETIAAGYPSPSSVVSAWMGSSKHYALLMHGEMREMGVGYVNGGSYGHYWTIDFGSQPDVLPVFINYEDPETPDPRVLLTLTNENVSGSSGIDSVAEVMVSNEPSFGGAIWQPYSMNIPWVLTDSNGTQMVYVRYRDSTGYETNSTDSILLNIPREFDLSLSTTALVFLYDIGAGFRSSSAKEVAVVNEASSTPMEWSLEVSDGGGWLEVTPLAGTTPGTVYISVAGFSTAVPGTYEATIVVTADEGSNSPESISVTVVAVDRLYHVFLPAVYNAP
ncbi:MAG: CAP domain-containing protein [Anaerolineae bacterium]